MAHRVRAQSDGSSDKHTGNERERLMDSTRLPLMGSGLTWLMAGALKGGGEEEEQRHHRKVAVLNILGLTHTHTHTH